MDIYQLFQYIDQFQYKFDFFRSISNFSIESGLVLINFVAGIDFDYKNLDRKSRSKGDLITM